jgi:hypothetical protein
MKKYTTGRRLAGVVLLASTLVCVGSCRTAPSTQLDLSVFQKEGAGKEQESKDRFECHMRAVQRTGFDPAVRPPDDTSPMRSQEKKELQAHQSVERRKQQRHYNDALQRCMAERGYTIVDH